MGKKITKQTKIKVGDLIAWKTTEGPAVYQVAKIEKNKKGLSPCICLNKSPDDKEFKKENGVDLWTRVHQTDLADHYEAEIIPIIELVLHYCIFQETVIFMKEKNKEAQELLADLKDKLTKIVLTILY